MASRWCGTVAHIGGLRLGCDPWCDPIIPAPSVTELCHPYHRGKPLLVNTAIATQRHLVALSAPIWVPNSRTSKHLFPRAGRLVITKRDTSIIYAAPIKGVARGSIKPVPPRGWFERWPSRVLGSEHNAPWQPSLPPPLSLKPTKTNKDLPRPGLG